MIDTSGWTVEVHEDGGTALLNIINDDLMVVGTVELVPCFNCRRLVTMDGGICPDCDQGIRQELDLN